MKAVRRVVAIICAWLCAAAVGASLWTPHGYVQTEDRNGDGRPDVWRYYDARGQLVRVVRDDNFNTHPDEDEYYVDGALIRREVDRNFDDRVDLVEDFSATTHEPTRSVVDVDFDGTADLLVLLQGGRPVFTKWADSVSQAGARDLESADPDAPGRLVPFRDPFRTDQAFRSYAARRTTSEAANTSLGAPTTGAITPAFAVSARPVVCASRSSARSPSTRHSRGPPPAPLA